MVTSVLPPPPAGMGPIPLTVGAERYISTGFFRPGSERKKAACVLCQTLFFDFDLADFLVARALEAIRPAVLDSSWFPQRTSEPTWKKLLALAEKAGKAASNEDLLDWFTVSLADPNHGPKIVKAWTYHSPEAAEAHEGFQMDLLDTAMNALDAVGVPTTIATSSGYGVHIFSWLEAGQGWGSDQASTGLAAADRVTKEIVREVNKNVGFKLLDPAATDAGTRLCREIGAVNYKGRTPKPVVVLVDDLEARFDLRTRLKRATSSVAQEFAQAASTPRAQQTQGNTLPGNTILRFAHPDEPDTVCEATVAELVHDLGGEDLDRFRCGCPFADTDSLDNATLHVHNWRAWLTCWSPNHNHPNWENNHAQWSFSPGDVAPPPEIPIHIEGERRDSEPPTSVPELSILDLAAAMQLDRAGTPRTNSAMNVELAVRYHPLTYANLWWDERRWCVRLGDRKWDDTTYFDLALAWERDLKLPPPSQKLVDAAALKIARENPRNVLKEWLETLVWDGECRLDHWLADCTGNDPSDRLISAYGAMTLIGAVRRVYEPGCRLEQVLLLISATQGRNKSSLFRTLCGEDWFLDTSMELDNKDSYMQLFLSWCYEWSENHKGRAVVERERMFISSSKDAFRRPYESSVEVVPRHSFIIATTNETRPLADFAGSRRWWPVYVNKKIDIAQVAELREQLWAEAVVRYKAGEQYWVEEGSELDALRAKASGSFTQEDPDVDTLVEFGRRQPNIPLRLSDIGLQGFLMSTNDVSKNTSRLSRACQKAGWYQIKNIRTDKPYWLADCSHLLPEGFTFSSEADKTRFESNKVIPFPEQKRATK
jgi:hypothetical protein